MGWVAPVIGAVGAVAGGMMQKNAAKHASDAQQATTQASIDEQRRQFDNARQLLDPYAKAGLAGLDSQANLMGINGNAAQEGAILNIEQSPLLQSMYKQAENAILQNASATGGLRGGNIQSALADNRMNMFNQAVQQQMQNLGGMVSVGQNAAAGVGNNGMALANNITQLNQNMGQSQAGYHLARGQAYQNMYDGLIGSVGMFGKHKGWF